MRPIDARERRHGVDERLRAVAAAALRLQRDVELLGEGQARAPAPRVTAPRDSRRVIACQLLFGGRLVGTRPRLELGASDRTRAPLPFEVAFDDSPPQLLDRRRDVAELYRSTNRTRGLSQSVPLRTCPHSPLDHGVQARTKQLECELQLELLDPGARFRVP